MTDDPDGSLKAQADEAEAMDKDARAELAAQVSILLDEERAWAVRHLVASQGLLWAECIKHLRPKLLALVRGEEKKP